MKKFFRVIAAVFVFAAAFTNCKSTGADGSADLRLNPAVVTGQLDNGMSYYVLKNKEPANRIVLRLVVNTGSCNEDEDQKGVAHFIEHLAFNGTEHFEKNSLIDYFELIGMDFGADLNAYTSFEETVYMLEIPADNPEFLKNALLILHDWASAITFEQSEIDKERGVVTEEWRSRRGLSGRIQDNYLPFILGGSRFEKRLPIGDMNVIKNVSRQRILDYYNKWYRPELMSVIVVGDEDTSVIINEIKAAMGSIPASEKKTLPSTFPVKYSTEKKVLIMKDSEQPYTIAQFMQPDEDYTHERTEADFRRNVAYSIAARILDQRMEENCLSPDSPWLSAGVIRTSNTNFTLYNGLAFIPKDGKFVEGMKQLLDEYDRFMLFGATDSEIERTKKTIYSEIEQGWKNRKKVKSASVAEELIGYVTEGELSLSEDDAFKLYKKYLPKVTSEEIYEVAKDYLKNRMSSLFVLAPEKADIPSEKAILELWNNYRNSASLTAYADEVPDGEIMKKPSSKGKVVSKQAIKELGANVYILENGLKIITKKTNFEDHSIRMAGLSRGGTSLVSEEDYPSATQATMYSIYSGANGMNYTQFSKATASKNVNLSVKINRQSEVFSGKSSDIDMETMLQMVHLMMTRPQFTDEGWNQVMVNAEQEAASYGAKPMDVYLEKIKSIIYGDSIRYSSMTPRFLSKLDKNVAEKIFRERFSNAADFSFIFVGDFNEKNLIDLCCSYLGTIPGDSSKLEQDVYEPFNFPKGITKQTVRKGKEEQGTVFIAFGGNLPAVNMEENWKDRAMMGQLQSFLDMRLREVVREEKGGTYGVGVYGSIDGLPERYYMIQINFGCEPSRAEELTGEVIKAIKEIQTASVDPVYVEKINEIYRRNRESNLRNNSWWVNTIAGVEVLEYDPMKAATEVEIIPSLTTPEALQELAKKYLDVNNYVVVYLKPEK